MSTWVLLRGLTRESRHWGELPQRMRSRLPGAQIVAPDLPGNGRLNRVPSPITVAAMTVQLRASLQSEGWVAPFHLLAMSMGAMVAIDWAARHPNELAGIVLVNTSVGRMQPFHRRLKPSAWLPLLRSLMPGLDDAGRERIVLTMTSNGLTSVPPGWAEYRRTHPVSRENALRQLLAAMRFEAPHQPPAVPVLVLSAAADRLVDPRCSRSLAQRWQAAHAEHPQAGHDIALDDGAWLVEQIVAWDQRRRRSDNVPTTARPASNSA